MKQCLFSSLKLPPIFLWTRIARRCWAPNLWHLSGNKTILRFIKVHASLKFHVLVEDIIFITSSDFAFNEIFCQIKLVFLSFLKK